MPKRKAAAQVAADEPTTLAATVDEVVQSAQDRAADTSFDPAQFDAPAKPESVPARDPFPLRVASLTDDNDGAKARLFRNNRYQQVAIQLDEKPPQEVIDQLRDAGFQWRGQDKVWAKALDREAKWQTQAAAEKLFDKVTDEIRQANGCGQQIG